MSLRRLYQVCFGVGLVTISFGLGGATAYGQTEASALLDVDGDHVTTSRDILHIFRVSIDAPQTIFVSVTDPHPAQTRQAIVRRAQSVLHLPSSALDLDGIDGIDPYVDLLNLYHVFAHEPDAVIVLPAARALGTSRQDIIRAAQALLRPSPVVPSCMAC